MTHYLHLKHIVGEKISFKSPHPPQYKIHKLDLREMYFIHSFIHSINVDFVFSVKTPSTMAKDIMVTKLPILHEKYVFQIIIQIQESRQML